MGRGQRASCRRLAPAPASDGASVAVRGVSGSYRAPELLAEHHDLDAFSCSSVEQTDWLRNHARQSANTGTTRVFVVTNVEAPEVVAYYGWCMAQITTAAGPARLRKGSGR